MDRSSVPSDAFQLELVAQNFDTDFDNVASAGSYLEDIDTIYSFSWAENVNHLPDEQRESLEGLERQTRQYGLVEPQTGPNPMPWSTLRPSVSPLFITRSYFLVLDLINMQAVYNQSPAAFVSQSTMPENGHAFLLNDHIDIPDAQHRTVTTELGESSSMEAVESNCRSNDVQKRIKALGEKVQALGLYRYGLLASKLDDLDDMLSKEECSTLSNNKRSYFPCPRTNLGILLT